MKMMVFTYDGITRGRCLGSGSTAIVYRGDRHGQSMAVKELSTPSNIQRRAFRRELAILKEVQHKNIVHALGFYRSPELLTLFSELCEGGCLFDLLHKTNFQLRLSQQGTILRSVATAMEYLHGMAAQVVHRDLKSLNILLAKPLLSTLDTPCVKLCDFGSARMMEHDSSGPKWINMTRDVGTSHWRAPEVSSGVYDEKVDVYSFAMLIFETLSYEIPYVELMVADIPMAVSQGVRPDSELLDPDCPPFLSDLMEKCWSPLSAERPSFADICSKLSGFESHRACSL
mmetsp:Transcript_37823/g.82971  ORF Transcript_37823/g.82971 Transcript_37823/m.82971 type:complete len:286 (+) Transcript_37823:20-877(+)